MQGRYQIVTDGHSDGGLDEKKSYYYLKDAKKAVEEYLSDGWEGAAIYDIISGKWHSFYGDFRRELVLENNETVFGGNKNEKAIQRRKNKMQYNKS